ncbi:hypothetical protein F5Y08DRAFT_349413 [Xylaria arbuscula]|nr:hypothetical protein F5Y08DRAFT_349413 [Xylaria arbuscula]
MFIPRLTPFRMVAMILAHEYYKEHYGNSTNSTSPVESKTPISLTTLSEDITSSITDATSTPTIDLNTGEVKGTVTNNPETLEPLLTVSLSTDTTTTQPTNVNTSEIEEDVIDDLETLISLTTVSEDIASLMTEVIATPTTNVNTGDIKEDVADVTNDPESLQPPSTVISSTETTTITTTITTTTTTTPQPPNPVINADTDNKTTREPTFYNGEFPNLHALVESLTAIAVLTLFLRPILKDIVRPEHVSDAVLLRNYHVNWTLAWVIWWHSLDLAHSDSVPNNLTIRDYLFHWGPVVVIWCSFLAFKALIRG